MTDDLAFETFAKAEIASRPSRIAELVKGIPETELSDWHAVLVEGCPAKDFIFRRSYSTY